MRSGRFSTLSEKWNRFLLLKIENSAGIHSRQMKAFYKSHVIKRGDVGNILQMA